jgi:cyclopropane-fatty-acyl-phospholipid synthase
MIYTFKSPAAADVIMQRFSAEKILSIIGKNSGETGVITVGEMEVAVTRLESEIKIHERGAFLSPEQASDHLENYDTVRLRESAAPFIDLLKKSHQADVNVVWGL